MLLTSDLVYVPIVLATAYLLTTLFILLSLHTSKQLFFTLSLRKLFSYSCLMLCCLRVTAFTSMACLNAYSSSSRADDDSVLPNSSNHILFEKAMLVLFDLPDYCFLGAYLLLLLKWGDVFMLSRRHWLNDHSYRTYKWPYIIRVLKTMY